MNEDRRPMSATAPAESTPPAEDRLARVKTERTAAPKAAREAAGATRRSRADAPTERTRDARVHSD